MIDARAEDPAEVLQRHGGADVAIGLAVDDRSFATAYAGLRRGGRLVLVALPASGALRIPVFDTVLNGTSVIGSVVGTRADLIEVFGLHVAGRTRVIYETRPLASVNDAISEVLHGKAQARLVLEPSPAGWPRPWPQEKLRFHVLAGSGVSYVIHGALSPRTCRA